MSVATCISSSILNTNQTRFDYTSNEALRELVIADEIEKAIGNKKEEFRTFLAQEKINLSTSVKKRFRLQGPKIEKVFYKLQSMTNEIFDELGLWEERVSYQDDLDIDINYTPFEHSMATCVSGCQRISGNWLPDHNVVAMSGIWRKFGAEVFLNFIIEHKVALVIRLADNGQIVKPEACRFYEWLPDGLCESSPRKVISITEDVGLNIRRFFAQNDLIQDEVECREVYVDNWPDKEALSTETLIDLIEEIRQIMSRPENKGRPIVVHCYAGYGRTGTFLVAKEIMDKIDAGEDPDVIEIILRHRCYRGELFVMTLVQLQALLELKEVYQTMVNTKAAELLELVAQRA